MARLTPASWIKIRSVTKHAESVQLALAQLSYPCGGGEHVLLSELEAINLLQDHSAVVFALEEVGAAEYGGDTLGLLSLDQHCGRGVVGLHAPEMVSKRAGGKEPRWRRSGLEGREFKGMEKARVGEGWRMKMENTRSTLLANFPQITYTQFSWMSKHNLQIYITSFKTKYF